MQWKHRPLDPNDKKLQICWHCAVEGCPNLITHHLSSRDKEEHGYNVLLLCDTHYNEWILNPTMKFSKEERNGK